MVVKLLKAQLFIISFLSISACSQLAYYSQSINGQWQVNRSQKPISEIIKDGSFEPDLKQRLALILKARQFATETLLLPNNKSYTDYADLKRDYIVWNIVFTKPLSITPETSCFFIVGCLDYRGYFNEDTAVEKARRLKQQGYDVLLGGVAAYSTLGWFDDPVLNTMMHWDDTKLISIIFHELAHQKLYVKNDTEFNEAFADAIAFIGIEKWLSAQDNLQAFTDYKIKQKQHEEFIDLILDYRTQLELLYGSELNESEKYKRKQIVFAGLLNAYETLKLDWKSNRYDDWFYNNLNNAKIAAVASYRRLMPAFLNLFEQQDRNLARFYAEVDKLSNLNKEERHSALQQNIEKRD